MHKVAQKGGVGALGARRLARGGGGEGIGGAGSGFLQKLRTPGATGFFSPKCRIKEKKKRKISQVSKSSAPLTRGRPTADGFAFSLLESSHRHLPFYCGCATSPNSSLSCKLSKNLHPLLPPPPSGPSFPQESFWLPLAPKTGCKVFTAERCGA